MGEKERIVRRATTVAQLRGEQVALFTLVREFKTLEMGVAGISGCETNHGGAFWCLLMRTDRGRGFLR